MIGISRVGQICQKLKIQKMLNKVIWFPKDHFVYKFVFINKYYYVKFSLEQMKTA